jgi:hypothetical protein
MNLRPLGYEHSAAWFNLLRHSTESVSIACHSQATSPCQAVSATAPLLTSR